jgi:hypothetical protein
VILHGRPARGSEAKRGARLERKKLALNDPTVAKELGAEVFDWWVESSSITIEFDAQGRVERVRTALDYRGEGTPSLDTPVQPAAEAPVKPAP